MPAPLQAPPLGYLLSGSPLLVLGPRASFESLPHRCTMSPLLWTKSRGGGLWCAPPESAQDLHPGWGGLTRVLGPTVWTCPVPRPRGEQPWARVGPLLLTANPPPPTWLQAAEEQ